MAEVEKWDETDIRRDFRKTRFGHLLLGIGLGAGLAAMLLSVIMQLVEWPTAAYATILACVFIGVASYHFGTRALTRSKSVKVSGTWGTKGGWRKRRL